MFLASNIWKYSDSFFNAYKRGTHIPRVPLTRETQQYTQEEARFAKELANVPPLPSWCTRRLDTYSPRNETNSVFPEYSFVRYLRVNSPKIYCLAKLVGLLVSAENRLISGKLCPSQNRIRATEEPFKCTYIFIPAFDSSDDEHNAINFTDIIEDNISSAPIVTPSSVFFPTSLIKIAN